METYSDHYYQNVRSEILCFLIKGEYSVLELGCGLGETLKYLKRNGYAANTVGVDIMPRLADTDPGEIDTVLTVDLERFDPSIIPQRFDIIIINDVLEHLKEPLQLLRSAIALLRETGTIIVSIPTLRNWNVMYKLLIRGDFRYEDNGGILDRGHIRFFTLKTMKALFATAGLRIVDQASNVDNHWLAKLLVRLPLFNELGVVQYLFKLQVDSRVAGPIRR
jgi:2-polyprenyl-3-methyl-5-hydroxy-6-metoxy-1,4-benzoquinol methylase